MYLQAVTRPDIAFAVNVASRALEKPTKAHWIFNKRIFRYLKGHLGLQYEESIGFEAYSNADFDGDWSTRKSMTGVVCKYGGAEVSWLSSANSVLLSLRQKQNILQLLKVLKKQCG